jgi:hypothetical protein
MTAEHRQQMADLYHFLEKYENVPEDAMERVAFLDRMKEDVAELRKKHNGDRRLMMMAAALVYASADYEPDEYTIVTIIKKNGGMSDEDCLRRGLEKL